MNDLVVFQYQDVKVRVVKDDQGDPWFVFVDLCAVLELVNPSQVATRIEKDALRIVEVTDSLGRTQKARAVNEAGMYETILMSRTEPAKKVKRWVTREVLPSIARTGKYEVPAPIESPFKLPTTFSEALHLAADLQDKVEAQEKRLALAAPKEAFFDAVADSKTAIDMGSAAKVLDCGVGRNTLFQLLRDRKILMDNNRPYQTYVDRGYFRVVEQKYTKPDGSTEINIKTLVYQAGLNYIMKTLALTPRKVA